MPDPSQGRYQRMIANQLLGQINKLPPHIAEQLDAALQPIQDAPWAWGEPYKPGITEAMRISTIADGMGLIVYVTHERARIILTHFSWLGD